MGMWVGLEPIRRCPPLEDMTQSCTAGSTPASQELCQLSLARAYFAITSKKKKKTFHVFPSQTSDKCLQGCIFRGNLAGYESAPSGSALVPTLQVLPQSLA